MDMHSSEAQHQTRKVSCSRYVLGAVLMVFLLCGMIVSNLEVATTTTVQSPIRDSPQSKANPRPPSSPNPLDYPVPNFVHFIWLSFQGAKSQLTFTQYLSILSAYRYISPDVIFFHTNNPPSGKYWDMVSKFPKFHVLERNETKILNGVKLKEPKYSNQASDLERLRILSEFGGIYLDLDVLVINSFSPLRMYSLTLGDQGGGLLCNGIIVAQKGEPLLDVWMQSFITDYRTDHRSYNAVNYPSTHLNRSLIHIEASSLHKPSYNQLNLIFGPGQVDWRGKYALHSWHYMWGYTQYKEQLTDVGLDYILNNNNTFAQVARHIYLDRDEQGCMAFVP